MMINFYSADEASTGAIAQQIASRAKVGDVFALYGTLGMGKSVFARAFIKSLTNAEEVPSPTFTLLQTYDAENFDIYHYDLYRIKAPEEVFELNIEEAMYEGVCLIEWPEKMGGYLPRQVFKLTITPQAEGRLITLECANEQKLERFADMKVDNV